MTTLLAELKENVGLASCSNVGFKLYLAQLQLSKKIKFSRANYEKT
jgi:hypothetical protein